MKTASALAFEIRHGLTWTQHDFKKETGKDFLEEAIKQIQLDAMKEGARRATEQVMTHTYGDGRAGIRNAILSTAEQWTEKDL